MSVSFRIIDMDIEQIENTEMIIHLAGLTVQGESVYCQVLGYQPYCFLELPTYINWTSPKIQALKDYVQSRLPECPPDVMKYEIKKLCLYSLVRPFLRINFKTEDTIRHLKQLVKFKWRIEGFSKEFEANAFKLHEHNVPTIVKYIIERKFDSAGWITVKQIFPAGRPKDYSTCKYSIYTKPSFISKCTDISPDILVDPLICAFDIELHSTNRKSASPKPEISENVITMISLTFGRLTQSITEWKTYVITLFVGNKDPNNAVVIDCQGSEKKLIVEFIKLVKREKPDIFTGYNINGFDWSCILTRAEIIDGDEKLTMHLEKREKKTYGSLAKKLFTMGKLKYAPGKLVDLSWASSARGKQEIKYIKSTGIFNFDIYPEIRFNHTLPTYKLSYVADKFLDNQKKEDMPYQQMFAIFDMVEVLERNLENVGTGKTVLTVELAKKLIISKTTPEELLKIEGMTNHVADFYKQLKECTKLKHVVETARSFMLLLLKYVIQDARICPELMKFLNSLTSLWENANISNCPASYIYEKGQQIKVLAQYVNVAYNKNFVVPFYQKVKDVVKIDDDEEDDGKKNYQGATVLKVKKGLYRRIAVLDFASLYPSIMMAYNICHTQLVPEGDNTPDEECNIAKWSEHIRCEHDPEKRKKKKGEKAYCGDHCYRWRKHHGQDDKKGILPTFLENLKKQRAIVKKAMGEKQAIWNTFKKRETELTDEEKKEMLHIYRVVSVLNARQLAIKIQSNSSYGFLGATTGYFPLIEGAASVTYYGRCAIMKTITLVEEKYKGAEVIYGDSVTGKTPILLKINDNICVKQIDEIVNRQSLHWYDYPGFYKGEEKQQSPLDNIQVWTDQGWVKIKRIIRHRCNKQIFRVNSTFGCVDVTEDHSLIDINENLIKPQELTTTTELLTSFTHRPKKSLLTTEIITKDACRAMRLMMLCRELGHNVGVRVENNDYIIYSTDETTNKILQIIPLGTTNDYVYDLETECGRFHAGVGFNIVKNTDSVFIDFHETDIKTIWKMAKEAQGYVTSQFPPEMKIEVDHMYDPLFLKTKKKYSATVVDEDGTALEEISKGDINKRRDNCDAARDIYTLTETLIKQQHPQDFTLYEINNKILNIYRGQVALNNFIIYKGLKQLVEEYKKCDGHVLFAKRLEERGNVMAAGTRLEYVFIRKREKDLKSGERMEDWSYFLMNRQKDSLQIDYGYYVEHNILKPVTEILNIAYPAPEKAYYKPEDAFKRAIDVYLKPKWADELRGKSLEFKAKYIGRYSKRKALREAAQRYFAKCILDRLYRQHGLKIKRTHRPKIGASVIFLNDRVVQDICQYHSDWNNVIWQIKDKTGVSEWVTKMWDKR